MLKACSNLLFKNSAQTNIFTKNICFSAAPVFNFSNEKMVQFTEVFDKKNAEDKNQKVSSGRAWRANELRLKSADELHKLWYVLLKEKNTILSDNAYKKKLSGSRGPQGRMSKLKVSMARLLTVVSERKKVREDYRRQLEDSYVAEQRVAYEQQVKKDKETSIAVPEITHALMRAKYRDLRRGVDNTDYIQTQVDKETERIQLKEQLNEKYDYKNKKIVTLEQQQQQLIGNNNNSSNDSSDSKQLQNNQQGGINQFKSLFEIQMQDGVEKISEEEVLRAHVKNWKMLNLKQRRIIINFLQARRAKDAKKYFLKELDLLSQKIAHDSMQNRVSANQQ